MKKDELNVQDPNNDVNNKDEHDEIINQEINKTAEQEYTIEKTSKHYTRAVYNNFIRTYGFIPLNLILTFIINRIFLESDNYGIFIYSLVLIVGPKIILKYIPPSVVYIISYRLPELIIRGENEKAKGLMLYFFKIKLIASTPFFLGYLIFNYYFWSISGSVLNLSLIFLSPFIIFWEFQDLCSSFLISVKGFGLLTYAFFQEKIIALVGYLIIFINHVSPIDAVIYLSCLQSVMIFSYTPVLLIKFYKTFGKYEKERVSWALIKNYLDFGLTFSVYRTVKDVYIQVYSGFLNTYGTTKYNVYNNLCTNLTKQAYLGVSSPNNAVLLDLEETNQRKQVLIFFQHTTRLTTIIISYIIGIVFFLTPVYVTILYVPKYHSVIPFAQFYTFVIFFFSLNGLYENLYSVTKNHRAISAVNIITDISMMLMAFIGIIYFGFGGILFSRLIGASMYLFIYWYYGKYIKKEFKVSLMKNTLTFIVVIGIILLQYFLETFIGIQNLSEFLSNLVSGLVGSYLNINLENYAILDINFYNILIIGFTAGIQIVIFFVLFSLYVVGFRIFTKEDIERINKLNFSFPFKNKAMKLASKVLRSEK